MGRHNVTKGSTLKDPQSSTNEINFFFDVIPVAVSLASLGLSIYVVRSRARDNERREIENALSHLLKASLDYPLVDSRLMQRKEAWNPEHEDDCRYVSYCCMAFNLLQRCWRFTNGSQEKMKRIVHFDELISDHSEWWKADQENHSGYEPGFVCFVNSRIGTTIGETQLDKTSDHSQSSDAVDSANQPNSNRSVP